MIAATTLAASEAAGAISTAQRVAVNVNNVTLIFSAKKASNTRR